MLFDRRLSVLQIQDIVDNVQHLSARVELGARVELRFPVERQPVRLELVLDVLFGHQNEQVGRKVFQQDTPATILFQNLYYNNNNKYYLYNNHNFIYYATITIFCVLASIGLLVLENKYFLFK